MLQSILFITTKLLLFLLNKELYIIREILNAFKKVKNRMLIQ